MRRHLIFLIFLLFFLSCHKDRSTIDSSFQTSFELVGCDSDSNSDSNYGKPLIFLEIADPWASLSGEETPKFALYEKGQIIYQFIENNEVKRFEITLTSDEIHQVIQSFGITDDLFKLDSVIETSKSMDQPITILTLDLDKSKTFIVSGNQNATDVRMKTPMPFKTVYDKIICYRNDSAKVWIPQKIEVMFWSYNSAPNKRPWIKGFPDLKSSNTIKIDDDSYSVFLDKADYEEFLKFYNTISEKDAVEINGRKMSISYKMNFPNIRKKTAHNTS